MNQIVTTTQEKNMQAVESALVKNDISQLTTDQKLTYYNKICASVGLNPLTKPFSFLKLQGREVLYATKDCTEQLRKIHGVSTQIVSKGLVGDLYEVHVKAKDKTGKEDDDLAYVVVKGLSGADLANAMLKCVTKAKRRVTLSICGLGLLDESELDTVSGITPASNPQIQNQFKDVPQLDQAEQIDAPVVDVGIQSISSSDDLGSYVVKCGKKYAGMKLSELKDFEIVGYLKYIDEGAAKNQKDLTGDFLEFYQNATAYVNQKNDVGF
jgi:hypothetical protein